MNYAEMTKSIAPHHHGNLRSALIAAGIEILETHGVAGLSLRKIAARVGVSHAAPAHHFNGKVELLVAIAAQSFVTFADMMREGRAKAAPDPQSQLVGLCNGYLDFATQHEAQFELIFSTDIKNYADEELQRSSLRAFQILEETCALFEPAQPGIKSNEIMIWSLVHGYATLRTHNKLVRLEDGTDTPFEMILPHMVPKNP